MMGCDHDDDVSFSTCASRSDSNDESSRDVSENASSSEEESSSEESSSEEEESSTEVTKSTSEVDSSDDEDSEDNTSTCYSPSRSASRSHSSRVSAPSQSKTTLITKEDSSKSSQSHDDEASDSHKGNSNQFLPTSSHDSFSKFHSSSLSGMGRAENSETSSSSFRIDDDEDSADYTSGSDSTYDDSSGRSSSIFEGSDPSFDSSQMRRASGWQQNAASNSFKERNSAWHAPEIPVLRHSATVISETVTDRLNDNLQVYERSTKNTQRRLPSIRELNEVGAEIGDGSPFNAVISRDSVSCFERSDYSSKLSSCHSVDECCASTTSPGGMTSKIREEPSTRSPSTRSSESKSDASQQVPKVNAKEYSSAQVGDTYQPLDPVGAKPPRTVSTKFGSKISHELLASKSNNSENSSESVSYPFDSYGSLHSAKEQDATSKSSSYQQHDGFSSPSTKVDAFGFPDNTSVEISTASVQATPTIEMAPEGHDTHLSPATSDRSSRDRSDRSDSKSPNDVSTSHDWSSFFSAGTSGGSGETNRLSMEDEKKDFRMSISEFIPPKPPTTTQHSVVSGISSRDTITHTPRVDEPSIALSDVFSHMASESSKLEDSRKEGAGTDRHGVNDSSNNTEPSRRLTVSKTSSRSSSSEESSTTRISKTVSTGSGGSFEKGNIPSDANDLEGEQASFAEETSMNPSFVERANVVNTARDTRSILSGNRIAPLSTKPTQAEDFPNDTSGTSIVITNGDSTPFNDSCFTHTASSLPFGFQDQNKKQKSSSSSKDPSYSTDSSFRQSGSAVSSMHRKSNESSVLEETSQTPSRPKSQDGNCKDSHSSFCSTSQSDDHSRVSGSRCSSASVREDSSCPDSTARSNSARSRLSSSRSTSRSKRSSLSSIGAYSQKSLSRSEISSANVSRREQAKRSSRSRTSSRFSVSTPERPQSAGDSHNKKQRSSSSSEYPSYSADSSFRQSGSTMSSIHRKSSETSVLDETSQTPSSSPKSQDGNCKDSHASFRSTSKSEDHTRVSVSRCSSLSHPSVGEDSSCPGSTTRSNSSRSRLSSSGSTSRSKSSSLSSIGVHSKKSLSQSETSSANVSRREQAKRSSRSRTSSRFSVSTPERPQSAGDSSREDTSHNSKARDFSFGHYHGASSNESSVSHGLSGSNTPSSRTMQSSQAHSNRIAGIRSMSHTRVSETGSNRSRSSISRHNQSLRASRRQTKDYSHPLVATKHQIPDLLYFGKSISLLKDLDIGLKKDLIPVHASVRNEGYRNIASRVYQKLSELRPRVKFLLSEAEWIHVHVLLLYARVFDCELFHYGIALPPEFKIDIPNDIQIFEPLAAILASIGIVRDELNGVTYVPVAKPYLGDTEYTAHDPEDVTEFLEWTQKDGLGYDWTASWEQVELGRESRKQLASKKGVKLPAVDSGASDIEQEKKMMDWNLLAVEKWLGWDHELWHSYSQVSFVLSRVADFVPFSTQSKIGSYSWLLPRTQNSEGTTVRVPNHNLTSDAWMIAAMFDFCALPQVRTSCWYIESKVVKDLDVLVDQFLEVAITTKIAPVENPSTLGQTSTGRHQGP